MKGHVLGIDGERGVIAGDDGNRYAFGPAGWRGAGAPAAGTPVDFVAAGSDAADIYPDVAADHEPPVEGIPSNGKLIPRLRSLIVQPAVEWQAIAAEEIGVGRLIGKTALLAAIAMLVVGLQIGGFFFVMFAFLPGTGSDPAPGVLAGLALGGGTLFFVLVFGIVSALVRVLIEGLVARLSASGFDGRGDFRDGLKLATFASTPLWLAAMIPIVGLFLQWVGGLYAIYLVYLGAGPVLRVPRSKRAVFTAITVIGSWFASMVLFFAVYMIVNVGLFAFIAAIGAGTAAVGNVAKP